MTTEQLLSKYPEEVSTLFRAAHSLLLKELTTIIEMPDASANIIGYGYSNKYNDMICTIILSKKGLKIGFNRGSELPDPKKMLAGTGKVHKYVQINSVADIKNPALKKLIKEGYKAWKKRTKFQITNSK